MSVEVSRYAPPRACVSDVIPGGRADAEAIRRAHITHEASVRSIGSLYWLSGGFLLIGGFAAVLMGAVEARRAIGLPELLSFVFFLVSGGLSIVVGSGIRALRPWARTTCIVLSVIGLLGIPFGTIISGYILYLLLGARGKRLFEPDYEAIVEATPHIKYRTSMIVWFFVGLLGLLILAVLVAGLFGSMSATPGLDGPGWRVVP